MKGSVGILLSLLYDWCDSTRLPSIMLLESNSRLKKSFKYSILLASLPSREAEDDSIRSCLLSGVKPRRSMSKRIRYAISVPDVPRFKCSSSMMRWKILVGLSLFVSPSNQARVFSIIGFSSVRISIIANIE